MTRPAWLRLARGWLTRGHAPRDYVPLAIAPADVRHRACLSWGHGSAHSTGSQPLDVSGRQWTLGYNPVMVGLAVPADVRRATQAAGGTAVLTVSDGGVPLSTLQLVVSRDLPDVGVLMFRAARAQSHCLDVARREVLVRRLHRACVRRQRTSGELTHSLYRQYVAQFCYPRRVVVPCVSGATSSDRRAFPIDLHGLVAETGACVLGIRHGNGAVPLLGRSRQLALCEVAAVHQPDLYALGKFGFGASDERGAGSPGPGMNRRTEDFGIAVPDFASGWRKVRVVHDEDIGAQRLFCGFVQRVEGGEHSGLRQLHHLHMVPWLAMSAPYPRADA